MSKEAAMEQEKGQSMLTLFNGVQVQSKWEKALKIEHVVKPAEPVTYKSGKNKGKVKIGKSGKALMTGPKDYTVIAVLPKVAGENEDGSPRESIARRFETTDGQQIMGIDLQVRKEAAEAVCKKIMADAMTGELVFNRARRNNINGSLSLSFKASGVKVLGAPTKEQAMAVLGLTAEQVAAAKATQVTQAEGNGNGSEE